MKFEISRTSDYSSTTAPCEGTIVEHASYEKWGLKDYTYHTKEFNTLEELMDFIQNVANGKVVIEYDEVTSLYEIEIYDTWRE